MKRSSAILSGLLCLILFFVWQTAPTASATETLYISGVEKRTLLQDGPDSTMNVMARWHEKWEEQNPGFRIRSSYKIGCSDAKELIRALSQRNNRKDVLFLPSDSFDLSELVDARALHDLSGIPELAGAAALLHPFLQAHIRQQGGLWALPCRLYVYDFMHFDEAALTLAGYTRAEMPASFEEALDFLEQWILRCRTDPVQNVCVTNIIENPSPGSYTRYLTERLIEQYTFQCAAQGLRPDFTDPVFLRMLNRISVIGPELYLADPRGASFCLFTPGSLPNELINLIPGRMTAEEPIRIPVHVTYLCANAHSAHPEAAARFIQLYLSLMRSDADVRSMTHDDADMLMAKALLFQDATGDIVSYDFAWRESYVRETIAYYEGIANSASAGRQERDQARARLRQYEQTHWLENAIKSKYQLTADELAQWQAMTGAMSVCDVDYTVIASKQTRSLIKQFASGSLSAEALAQGLNEQLR